MGIRAVGDCTGAGQAEEKKKGEKRRMDEKNEEGNEFHPNSTASFLKSISDF